MEKNINSLREQLKEKNETTKTLNLRVNKIEERFSKITKCIISALSDNDNYCDSEICDLIFNYNE